MKIIILSLLSVLFVMPAKVNAQMFSVGDETRERANPFAPYLRAGVRTIDFSYQGDPGAITENRDLSFSGTAAQSSFESGGFNIGVSLGNDITGIDNHRYFDLFLKFTNPFYIIRRQNFGAGIPVQLGTKLTNVSRDDGSTEFSQTNLNVGGGGILHFIVPEKLSISTQFMPHIGFSTASGGFVGGNVFSLTGRARLNFFNLIFGRNVSIGYDYDFDSYNIDDEELDYDFSGHTITLGISL